MRHLLKNIQGENLQNTLRTKMVVNEANTLCTGTKTVTQILYFAKTYYQFVLSSITSTFLSQIFGFTTILYFCVSKNNQSRLVLRIVCSDGTDNGIAAVTGTHGGVWKMRES